MDWNRRATRGKPSASLHWYSFRRSKLLCKPLQHSSEEDQTFVVSLDGARIGFGEGGPERRMWVCRNGRLRGFKSGIGGGSKERGRKGWRTRYAGRDGRLGGDEQG